MTKLWPFSELSAGGRNAKMAVVALVCVALANVLSFAQQIPSSPQPSHRQSHSRLLRKHLIKPASAQSQRPQPANWIYVPESPRTIPLSVACGGDLDGDGYADLVIGEPEFDHGRGRLLIFGGSTNGLGAAPKSAVEGLNAGEGFGTFVTMVGDVNGDGFDDFFVRSDSLPATTNQMVLGWILLGNAAGLLPRTPFPNDVTGAAGDLNGDGYDDLTCLDLTHPIWDVVVHYGSQSGPILAVGAVLHGEQAGSRFGNFVAAAGDVNRDGYSDLLISAFKYSGRLRESGKVYLFYGSAAGLQTVPAWTSEYPLPVRPGVDEEYKQFFGWAISSAGDVNHDGFDDVLVGAAFADHNDLDEGLAFLFYGSPRGLSPTPGWWAESNHSYSLFGRALGFAGDVNGDGCDDLFVTAPQAMDGQLNEGAAVLYYGSRTGPPRWPQWSMESDHTSEQFGGFARCAGDLNGDGFADILFIGLDYGKISESRGPEKFGRVVACYGGPKGLLPSHDWELRKPALVALQQELDIYHRQWGSIVYWGPAFLTLIAVSLSFLLVQRRLRRQLITAITHNRQLASAQERARLARDVHDHLGAQLTQMALWTDIAKSSSQQPQALAEHLERVSGLIKSAVTDVSQLVWTMNPANDNLENFVAYLGDFVAEFLKPSSLELVLELPEVIPVVGLATASRSHLLSAIKEALHNVICHAKAARVTVRVWIDDRRLRIAIEDNGIGFQVSHPASNGASALEGNGLRNLSTRLAEVCGTTAIRSAPGQGTTVSFELQLPSAAAPT